MNNCENTDREIWRLKPGDFYSPSIHVTDYGGIGINFGGHVIVAPVKMWHEAGAIMFCVNQKLPSWRRRLAMWILKT